MLSTLVSAVDVLDVSGQAMSKRDFASSAQAEICAHENP
jgi:hypothetical protein